VGMTGMHHFRELKETCGCFFFVGYRGGDWGFGVRKGVRGRGGWRLVQQSFPCCSI